MRGTQVPPNVTRSTKLRGAQHFPKLTFRSTDFCVPENLIFPALYLTLFPVTSLKRFLQSCFQLLLFSTVFLHALWISCLLYWWFLVYFIQKENETKEGKYPNKIQILTFFAQPNEWFVWREGCIDCKRNLTDDNLIRKCLTRIWWQFPWLEKFR